MAELESKAAGFRKALSEWYETAARDLPWRRRPSLYRTVVSEFMLQQTQVKTVLPYFARWQEQFPDFKTLAAASSEAVLKAWEGLGYYSRARNLHQLAQAVTAMPQPPQTPGEWLELPGIGPYTAAAVTSISFGYPAACVDGNVVRILARLTADGTPYRDSGSAAKAFTALANSLIGSKADTKALEASATQAGRSGWTATAESPGNHNQAMMELGATICTKHNPQCLICPVSEFCAAGKAGDPEDYPVLASKTIEYVEVVRVWCVRRGALLLHRAGAASSRLAGQHELPTAEQAGISSAVALEGKLLAKKTRGITRYRITESIHAAEPPEFAVAEGSETGELVWAPLTELANLTLSGPHRRWVTELLSAAPETGARSAPRAAASKPSRPRRRSGG